MRRTLVVAVIIATMSGCGSSPTQQPVDDYTQGAPTSASPETSPRSGEPYTDAGGVQRATIDPASMQATRCRTTTDEGLEAGSILYGVESQFRAKNTTPLTGTLSLTVQYQNGDGDAITEGNPGANNIRPGQTAKIDDSMQVEKGDLPGDKVQCVVVQAELYVPIR